MILAFTVGVLFVYSVGAVLEFHSLAGVSVVPGILSTVIMLVMPETPIYLFLKYGPGLRVEKALSQLRDVKSDVIGELEVLASEARQCRSSTGFRLHQVTKPEIYKPFLYGLALMFFQQFSGIQAIIFYSTNIFESTGSTIDSSLSTIIIGVAQVLGTICGCLLIDRLGRKVLLNFSGCGHFISLTAMGYFFYKKASNDSFATTTGWLPIASLIVFNLTYMVGYGPIPWLMVPEMLPVQARGILGSIVCTFNWISSFIVTKYFISLSQAIQPYGTFWLFAAFSVLGVCFTAFILPETKGRTFEQIQKGFTRQ